MGIFAVEMMVRLHLMKFYTDVAGLSAELAGLANLVPKAERAGRENVGEIIRIGLKYVLHLMEPHPATRKATLMIE